MMAAMMVMATAVMDEGTSTMEGTLGVWTYGEDFGTPPLNFKMT